jgi:endonuclease III
MASKLEKAKIIQSILDRLYPDPPIPLKHKDNYTLLVAVLLSAQCTDVKVNQITPLLFSKADNPLDMQKLSPKEIEAIIRPCGLAPQKSQSIFNLSKILTEKFKGMVPDNFEDLESLPGVGHKTASVVMSQAFKHPAFPVDTHIHRLAQRWGLTSGKNVKVTEADLKKIFPQDSWNKLHLQIIYYGREHCGAKSCDGTKCIICKALFPKRKKIFIHRKA